MRPERRRTIFEATMAEVRPADGFGMGSRWAARPEVVKLAHRAARGSGSMSAAISSRCKSHSRCRGARELSPKRQTGRRLDCEDADEEEEEEDRKKAPVEADCSPGWAYSSQDSRGSRK